MIVHAGEINNGKTLCGLSTLSNNCGWVFTEDNMKLNKGQMHSLFKDRVTCEECLKIAKETRLKDVCGECGKELDCE